MKELPEDDDDWGLPADDSAKPETQSAATLKRLVKQYREQTISRNAELPISKGMLDLIGEQYITREFVDAMKGVVTAFDEAHRHYLIAEARQNRDRAQQTVIGTMKLITELEANGK